MIFKLTLSGPHHNCCKSGFELVSIHCSAQDPLSAHPHTDLCMSCCATCCYSAGGLSVSMHIRSLGVHLRNSDVRSSCFWLLTQDGMHTSWDGTLADSQAQSCKGTRFWPLSLPAFHTSLYAYQPDVDMHIALCRQLYKKPF